MELGSIAAVKMKGEKGSEKAGLVDGRGDQIRAVEEAESEREADAESTSWFSWLPRHCVVS